VSEEPKFGISGVVGGRIASKGYRQLVPQGKCTFERRFSSEIKAHAAGKA
jgi:hypothetical protein